MPAEIRVIIADDHPIFRGGLKQVLSAHSTLQLVDEVADGESALRSIERLKPEVAIIDIDMPGKNGLEVVRELREQRIDIPIIFLTMYNDREMFDKAMDLGVRGYVLKESAAREIVDSVQLVAAGKYFVSPSLHSFLVDRRARATDLQKEVPGLRLLTPTERKVLKLIAEGKTSKEIGAALNVSARTVDNHRLNISEKLGIHGSHQLLKFAIQNGSLL